MFSFTFISTPKVFISRFQYSLISSDSLLLLIDPGSFIAKPRIPLIISSASFLSHIPPLSTFVFSLPLFIFLSPFCFWLGLSKCYLLSLFCFTVISFSCSSFIPFLLFYSCWILLSFSFFQAHWCSIPAVYFCVFIHVLVTTFLGSFSSDFLFFLLYLDFSSYCVIWFFLYFLNSIDFPFLSCAFLSLTFCTLSFSLHFLVCLPHK